MKLFCGKSPKALGIEDAEGNWDMVKFGAHAEACGVCSCGTGKIAKYFAGKGGRAGKRKLSSSQARNDSPVTGPVVIFDHNPHV